ncbi:mitochondrial 37S ribosomal protein RSM10 [Perkinsela sp. CCAP 1560/4]|nr:mitochondrial 37S ribosomal protein RSM10 [Perkinsela sp. CCAP 1560/4]|eukprot:KNH06647.1 mitochondrial 37S ribosomal protein RSM10 [Perkinsela sp. CCAP 1560/4]
MERKEFRTINLFHAAVIENLENKLRKSSIPNTVVSGLVGRLKEEILLLSPKYYHEDQEVLSGNDPVMLNIVEDNELEEKASTVEPPISSETTTISYDPQSIVFPSPDIGPNTLRNDRSRWIVIAGPCFFLEEKGAQELAKSFHHHLSHYWKESSTDNRMHLFSNQTNPAISCSQDVFSGDESFGEVESGPSDREDASTAEEPQRVGWNPFSIPEIHASSEATESMQMKKRKTFVHPFLEHGVYFGTNPMTLSMYYGGTVYRSALCVDTEINSVTIDFSPYFKKSKKQVLGSCSGNV